VRFFLTRRLTWRLSDYCFPCMVRSSFRSHHPPTPESHTLSLHDALPIFVAAAALGDQGLDVQLLASDQGLAALQLGVELAPAQGLELGLGLALLLLEFGVLFGGLGLALEALELAPQLVADVGEALEVLLGAAHAVLGVAAALLVLGNAGGLLDEHPQVLRAGLDQVGDHALLDDGVAAGPKAGAEEDVGDVPAPALVAVEVVAGLAVSGDLAADGDLGVAGVLAAEGAVAVVEDELDGSLAHRLAAAGAVEDDVGHRFAPQVLGGAFAHHPAHGVDDVGFAAPVGAHNRAQIAGEMYRGRVHEGLEPRQLDALET